MSNQYLFFLWPDNQETADATYLESKKVSALQDIIRNSQGTWTRQKVTVR